MFKKYVRMAHLWLGLVSGLLVFIIAITGCLYAFQEEIQDLTDEYRFVQSQTGGVLPPSKLQEIAESALPGKVVHSVQYEVGRSAVITWYHYEPTYYYLGYINPYTGEMLHIQDMDKGFFNFILDGHMHLWLPDETGTVVVRWATIIFSIMVLSGIVLWFPKNRKVFRNRSWFRWKDTTGWKRKNWDMHSIFGFYTCFFALIFIITGLVWAMPSFASAYYSIIGGEKNIVYADAVSTQPANGIIVENAMDKIFYKTLAEHKIGTVEVHPPETDSSSILMVTNSISGTYYKSDYRYYNQYTLAELEVDHIWGKYLAATNADKILRLNYDIHVGAILGLPGKIFAFLISLLIASLPVTGTMIYLVKRRKRKALVNTPEHVFQVELAVERV